jgi:hypothetical protein
LRSGEAIRQEPREERIGNTVERGDEAADRPNATPKGPGSFVSWVRRKACPYFRYGLRLSPAQAPKSLRRSVSSWSQLALIPGSQRASFARFAFS